MNHAAPPDCVNARIAIRKDDGLRTRPCAERPTSFLTPLLRTLPAIDVQQTKGNLMVTAELPGLKKDEVKVELTDD